MKKTAYRVADGVTVLYMRFAWPTQYLVRPLQAP